MNKETSRSEKLPARLEDLDFVEKVREAFAGAILEEASETDPKKRRPGFTVEAAADIEARKKIEPRGGIESKLIRIGQDFRLTPDEIDELRSIFLK